MDNKISNNFLEKKYENSVFKEFYLRREITALALEYINSPPENSLLKNKKVDRILGLKEYIDNKPKKELKRILSIECKEKFLDNAVPFRYNLVTQNIRTLANEIEKMQFEEGEINRIWQLLEKGEWNEIKKIEQFPYIALHRFAKYDISYSEFATCLFNWYLISKAGIECEVVNFFDKKDTINLYAHRIISSTLKSSDEKKNSFYVSAYQHPNSPKEAGDITTCMIANMRTEAKSQHYFLIIRDQSMHETSHSLGNPTLIERFRLVGFNLLMEFIDPIDSTRKIMVAPFGLMISLLKIFAPMQYATPVPVIELSTLKSIENGGEKNTRDVFIPFPSIKSPREADTFFVLRLLYFWLHDWYHTYICSTAPLSYREQLITIARSIMLLKEKLINEGMSIAKYKAISLLDNMYGKLIDMDFGRLFLKDQTQIEKKKIFIQFLSDSILPLIGNEIATDNTNYSSMLFLFEPLEITCKNFIEKWKQTTNIDIFCVTKEFIEIFTSTFEQLLN